MRTCHPDYGNVTLARVLTFTTGILRIVCSMTKSSTQFEYHTAGSARLRQVLEDSANSGVVEQSGYQSVQLPYTQCIHKLTTIGAGCMGNPSDLKQKFAPYFSYRWE